MNRKFDDQNVLKVHECSGNKKCPKAFLKENSASMFNLPIDHKLWINPHEIIYEVLENNRYINTKLKKLNFYLLKRFQRNI